MKPVWRALLALALALCLGGVAMGEAAEPVQEVRQVELLINGSAEPALLEPGTETIDLAWDAVDGNGDWRVLIYGTSGRPVFDKVLDATRDRMTLDISRCVPGVYEVYLTAEVEEDGGKVTVSARNTFEVRAGHEVLRDRMDVSRQLLAYIDEGGAIRLASGYNGQEGEGMLSGDIPWESLENAVQVAVGSDHVVGLTPEGVVMGAGGNGAGQLKCVGLTGVRWIAAGSGCTACVMDSGALQLFGTFSDAQAALLALTGVSEVSISDTNVAVHFMDGTARALALHEGDPELDLGGWTDLKQVSAGYGYVLGLREDGTVLYAGAADGYTAACADWRDVVALSAGNGYALGLGADGTVRSAGNPNLVFTDTGEWQDMTDIAAGYYLCAGLRSDGTVEIQAE